MKTNFRKSLFLNSSLVALNTALIGALFLAPDQALACATVNSTTTISATTACVTWQSSNVSLTNTGSITGSNTGLSNAGNSVGNLTNSGLVGANFNNGHDALVSSGAIATITNNASIIGGTGINNNGGSIGTIINTGTISGNDATIGNNGGELGIANQNGTITSISNSGLISGTWRGYVNINTAAGTTGNINNSGTISGGSDAFYNHNGFIQTLTNTGTIIGVARYGIWNNNTGGIHTLINSGLLSGATYGIYNDNANTTINSLNNSGTIKGVNLFGLQNYGVYGTITNSGTLYGGNTAIVNHNAIGTLTNSGIIESSGTGISGIKNASALTSFSISATGTVSGNSYGIQNTTSPFNSGSGSISTLTNNGVIAGGLDGIINNQNSTIGALSNGGVIFGANAIFSDVGSTIVGVLTNSGAIEGNLNVAQALTITGGSAGTFGTLTGYNGATGTITTNNHNLTFDTNAYQLMDEDINVGTSNTVFNNGQLRVNASHAITGNYVQASGTTLVVGVTNPTHYGQLIVSGAATLTNDQILITPTSGTLVGGSTFTIVQAAAAGTSYSGVTATANGFTVTSSSIASGGNEDLILKLSGSPTTYAQAGQQGGGSVGGNVGAAIDQIQTLVGNGAQPNFAPILTALNSIGQQSPKAEGAAIKQLAPSQVAPQLSANNVAATQTMKVIGQHQQGLLSQTNGPVGRAAGSEYTSGVLWMQVDGGHAVHDASTASAGYHQNFYGVTFGIDDHLTQNATVGMAFSWSHDASRGSDDLNGDTVDTSTPELMGYGTYRMGPAFVDGMFGVGYNLFTQSRAIGFLGTTAGATYEGMQYMGDAEAGYDFNVTPRTVMTPLVGFQATRTDTNSYTEGGAGAADLTVGRQIIDSYATSLGGRVTTVVPTLWGVMTPEVKLAWLHDLNSSPISSNASLAGVAFATSTPRLSQDGAEVTLATTLQRTDAFSLRAEYDGDIRTDYQSHTGLLKGSYKF